MFIFQFMSAVRQSTISEEIDILKKSLISINEIVRPYLKKTPSGGQILPPFRILKETELDKLLTYTQRMQTSLSRLEGRPVPQEHEKLVSGCMKFYDRMIRNFEAVDTSEIKAKSLRDRLSLLRTSAGKKHMRSEEQSRFFANPERVEQKTEHRIEGAQVKITFETAKEEVTKDILDLVAIKKKGEEIRDNIRSGNFGYASIACAAPAEYGVKYFAGNEYTIDMARHDALVSLSELAKRYGYSEVNHGNVVDFLKGTKGQELLAKLKDRPMDAWGFASMEVFYDGRNFAKWSKAVFDNYNLAVERANLVLQALEEVNGKLSDANCANRLMVGKSRGKVCFFQELPDIVRFDSGAVSLAGFGYEGEGAQRFDSFVKYLKEAAESKPGGKFNETEIQRARDYFNRMQNSGAIALDGDNYVLKNPALFNTFFSRVPGDGSFVAEGASKYAGERDGMRMEMPKNVFVRAIEEGSTTGIPNRAVLLRNDANTGIYAAITSSRTGTEGEISVYYRIEDDAKKATSDIVNLKVFLFNKDTGRTEVVPPEKITQKAPGKFTVDVGAMNGTLIAYAETKNGEVNSGLVWKDVVSGKFVVIESAVAVKNARALPGTHKKIDVRSAARITSVRRDRAGKPIVTSQVIWPDSLMFFCPMDKNQEPVGLSHPDVTDSFKVKKGQAYPDYFQKRLIPVGRPLEIGKRKYSGEQLLKFAQEHGVGIRAQKLKSGKSVWVALDGSRIGVFSDAELKKKGFKVTNNSLAYAKSKLYGCSILSTAPEGAANRVYADGSKDAVLSSYTIPKEIPLPSKETQFGTKSYSASKIRKFAEQRIIALVELNKKGVATVYGLNGREIGPFNELNKAAGIPNLPGVFYMHEQGKAADFTLDVYVPDASNVTDVSAIIYSLRDKRKISVIQ